MQKKTYDLVYTAIFAILLAICSWISIPTVIPFTLQTFAVFLTLLVLGGKRGTSAFLVYLLLGAIGIPVFSNFGAGLGILLGNTGGYVLGFVLMGLLMWASDLLFGRKILVQLITLLLGLILCYAFGTFWFLFISSNGGSDIALTSVLGMCVLPFIVPDLCKLALAYALSKRFRRMLAFQD